MALSGSTAKKYTPKGAYWVWVEWTATQNVANNTSTITAITYAGTNSYGWYTTSNNGSSVTVNGATTSAGDSGDINPNTTKKELCRRTEVVTHNADGTKSVTISGRWWMNGSASFDLTSTGTFTLDTIPRASTPTLSPSSQAIGSAITINTNRASTSFTHTITYTFGNASGTIATGVGGSHSWTLPASLANQIPNTTSGVGSIKLITYSGSTKIGEKSISFTATVPNTADFRPTATGLTVSIAGSGRDKTIGRYVQGISKATMSFTATKKGGATIISNSINIKRQSDNANSMTINGTSGTSGTLTLSGTYIVTATTTDSRGRSSTATTTFSVSAYAVPKITNFTATRQNTTKTNVDTVRSGTYSYLGGDNPLSVIIARRPRGGSYTNLNTTAGLTDGTFTGTYVSTGNSETTSYDFKLTISDSFGNSAVAEITVPTSSVALSINGDIGIGVGKIHEQGALDVGGHAYINGNAYVGQVTGKFMPLHIPANSNLNNYTTAGMYYNSSNADVSTMTNVPTNNAFSLLVEKHAGTKQTFTVYSATNISTYVRNYYNGTWGAWRQVWGSTGQPQTHTHDTYGSNSNGHYLKMDNGTLLMWNTMTLAYSSSHVYQASWAFPHALASGTSAIVVGNRSAANVGNTGASGSAFTSDKPNTTSVFMRLFDPTNVMTSGLTLTVHVFAIGRWK